MNKTKVIILLSSKSSGSSALQKYLIDHYNVRTVSKVQHQENETLFWTKAASLLNLPQHKMHRSVVPYSFNEGLKLLRRLLIENDVIIENDLLVEEAIFESFKDLASKNGPTFFEKSPHHLFNYSNIDLILRCKEYLKDEVEFHIIGLIRNPMDTIYSAWSRWKYNCRAFEQEWLQSYRNMERLKEGFSDLAVFKYEDIVVDKEPVDSFCAKIGIEKKTGGNFFFNKQSLNKWKDNPHFMPHLEKETIEVAIRFGYQNDELITKSKGTFIWELREQINDLIYRLKKYKRSFTK